jgi:hypothetical protein
VTQSGVSAGSYLLMARTQLNSVSTLSSRIVCDASLGGKTGQGSSDIGTNAGNVAHAVITVVFNVTVAGTGTANLSCYADAVGGTAPTATSSYIELIQVESASSQVVTS